MKPSELDQLVIACIEVYAVELLDVVSAEKFFQKIQTDELKVRGHILLGQLKEAYLAAAKIESTESVNLVLEEAKMVENSRVVGLCEQYLKEKSAKNLETQSSSTDLELKII